jgi:hypothetical protein
MKTVLLAVLILGTSLVDPTLAQVGNRGARGDAPGRYNQSGGVNYAPTPGVYTVVSIDSYAQTVKLKAKDGRTADVYVGSDIYDVSKLTAGDRIQVDFLQPDGTGKRLSAATIWPVQ